MKRVIFAFLLVIISVSNSLAEIPQTVWGITLGDSREKVDSIIKSDTVHYKIKKNVEQGISFYYWKKDWLFFDEYFNYMMVIFRDGKVFSISLFPYNILYDKSEWVNTTKKVWAKAKDEYPNCRFSEGNTNSWRELHETPYLWTLADVDVSGLYFTIIGQKETEDNTKGITIIQIIKF